jgi:hypothetical protein
MNGNFQIFLFYIRLFQGEYFTQLLNFRGPVLWRRLDIEGAVLRRLDMKNFAGEGNFGILIWPAIFLWYNSGIWWNRLGRTDTSSPGGKENF